MKLIERARSWQVSLIYLNIVLYATCFQIQRPLEPFMIEKLKSGGGGGDVALEYAKLQSFFSLIQVTRMEYYYLLRVVLKHLLNRRCLGR